MTDIERKSVHLEFKDDKEGAFTARIATLDVVDSDGDLTKPGAFPEGKEILVSSYQHGSWMGELPVGKAVIHEDEKEVIAAGEFNLKTTTGRDHYEAVKFTGGLQEWSYGFLPIEAAEETQDGKKIRVLTKVDPFEISPVLKGAGVGTATLGIKDGEGWPYVEHMKGALAALASVTERSKALDDLRRKEGRVLSTANRDRIKAVLKVLSELKAELEALLKDSDPKDTGKAAATFLEYTRLRKEIMEVTK